MRTRLFSRLVDPTAWPFRSRRWENNGEWYERVVRIRKRKLLLPDGADVIAGGFAEKRIAERNTAYFERFARETCRAEAVHWISVTAAPLFSLWNTRLGTVINCLFAIAANLPCIAAQRYNRPHLRRIIEAARSAGGSRKDRS